MRSRRRLDLARSGLKPQLDLSLGVGYGTLDRKPRSVRAPIRCFTNNRVGPSVFRHARARRYTVFETARPRAFFSRAVRNRRRQSDPRQKSRGHIGNTVLTDIQALVNSAQALSQSIETTRHYRLTVDNELIKRRLGLSTLIDVINVEDRLTNALLSEVLARQAYANAIAQLRFDLGTMCFSETVSSTSSSRTCSIRESNSLADVAARTAKALSKGGTRATVFSGAARSADARRAAPRVACAASAPWTHSRRASVGLVRKHFYEGLRQMRAHQSHRASLTYTSLSGGRVTTLLVGVGDHVRIEQVVAQVAQPELSDRH
jgi:hypothetical protein